MTDKIQENDITRDATSQEQAVFDADRANAIKAKAQTDLDTSDRTILRCVEAQVPVPAGWHQYRVALRTVLNDPTQPYPAKPGFPAGT